MAGRINHAHYNRIRNRYKTRLSTSPYGPITESEDTKVQLINALTYIAVREKLVVE